MKVGHYWTERLQPVRHENNTVRAHNVGLGLARRRCEHNVRPYSPPRDTAWRNCPNPRQTSTSGRQSHFCSSVGRFPRPGVVCVPPGSRWTRRDAEAAPIAQVRIVGARQSENGIVCSPDLPARCARPEQTQSGLTLETRAKPHRINRFHCVFTCWGEKCYIENRDFYISVRKRPTPETVDPLKCNDSPLCREPSHYPIPARLMLMSKVMTRSPNAVCAIYKRLRRVRSF